ncbi:MAG: thioredoxin fold domain-containing protein [Thiovulaceae bacterium]|nr:thioredoxin fold domain-containing protein [Sulfurimonadaceae bacterium]
MKPLFLFITLMLTLLAKDVSTEPFKKLAPFKHPNIISIDRAYDHGSLYEVIFTALTNQGSKRISSFLTKDKKVIIYGQAVDIKKQAQLRIPLDLAKIKKEADIVFGSGKPAYIVITDPECRYCQVFQRKWKAFEKKFTLYVYMYPLSNHAQAEQMSFYVMNQKGNKAKANALIGISNDEKAYSKFKVSEKQRKKLYEKFAKNSALGDELGVRGTPAVFDLKGNPVNWQTLVK